ncbi:PIN domain-containing protein [Sunxiuqinia elliptica]|uniref:PIN like domain-containing protein n=1 Tax=Sunxiuqinia elliptica TaxID=655355 RepID=A0A4R6GMN2_9BACT|nr:PIN domain-containing protein [Sunxiuqinia elliptica]TDN95684.1 hypothetical protein DET52_1144 [Sunxiuqinia elliptica]TDO66879.1 hypothetical protein DET65_0462 [Sunxiuqinia elliptica]
MSENKRHFILKKAFPDPNSILNIKTKKLEELVKDALFVLDTNSLLAPFQAGKEGIDKIGKIYENLIGEERVYIPNHVLREFAKNRSLKISELFTNIDNLISSVPTIKPFEYPILSELDVYKTIKEKREQILQELKDYNNNLKELREGITNWNWSDPVSTMYSRTFNEASIIDTSLSEDELIKEYNDRIENDIPPGNKDKSKDDNAIGDFLIWKSIIELGKNKQKDIIFVSNDEKNDWLLKGNKKSIYTKFELVNEYYIETNGQNFVSINFQKFLELQGVDIELSQSLEIDNFFFENESTEPKEGTLNALEQVYLYVFEYLKSYGDIDDEELYITEKINEPIKHFLSSYQYEFFETPQWKYYADYLIRFSELLERIKSLNGNIMYEAFRKKRSTYTQMVEMKALSREFIKLYKEFESMK